MADILAILRAESAGISTAAAQKIGDALLATAGTTIYSGTQIGTAYADPAVHLVVATERSAVARVRH